MDYNFNNNFTQQMTAENNKKEPFVLCILDGWGLSDKKEESAIYKANPEFFNSLMEKYPHSELEASGIYVGLPDGQMGNSEVGHTNIGAGRVVFQDLPRITKAVKDNKIKKNDAYKECVKLTKKANGRVHLIGLLSDGGVHSHIDHIIDIAKNLAKEKLTVYMHCLLDGRDTAQKSAITYINKFIEETKKFDNVKIASIGGRYYGMDRDNKWDRIEKAYNVIVNGQEGDFSVNPQKIIEESYLNNITDEFIEPIAVNDYKGMQDGDSFIFCNFRADRARQLTKALCMPNFDLFERKRVINFSAKVQLTEYSTEHSTFMSTMFPPEVIKDSLGEVIANNGLKQLRIAETEKYAHVTFFFNCGVEKENKDEDRILIKSPAVATYDLKPEMSAIEVNNTLIDEINKDKYDFIVVNFANADMVGHTGKMDAAIQAIKTLDAELKKLVEAVLNKNGTICVTADHGNAEKMLDSETNLPCTTHTTNRVPFIVVSNKNDKLQLNNGSLSDIAPTVLKMLKIKQPKAMTGKSLIK